jgi:hypothetical protein
MWADISPKKIYEEGQYTPEKMNNITDIINF